MDKPREERSMDDGAHVTSLEPPALPLSRRSVLFNKVPDAQVTGDLDATLAYAKSTGKADTSRAAVIGFCWGGRQVWLYAAHNPSLKAGAAFYGPLVGQPNDMKPKNPTDIAGG